MAPWGADEENWRRNWRFVIIMAWLIIFTILTSYALKQSQDANEDTHALAERNTALIHRVNDQQIQIQKNAADAAYKLCLSVVKGKRDRISEYQFTLNRTKEFFAENPSANSQTSLQRTVDFYHDLIQRTKDQIVPCHNPQAQQ